MTDYRPEETPAEVAARKEQQRIDRLVADTRALLEQIPGYELEPASTGTVDGPQPAPTSRVLIDVARWDLENGTDLWNWCTLVIDEMVDLGEDHRLGDSPDARHPTIPAMCAFLAANIDWIIRYNDNLDCTHTNTSCGCFTADIRHLHHQYRRASGHHDPAHICPNCGWRIQAQDHASWFRCTGCGNTWRTDSEIRRLNAAQDNVMTLGQIAKQTGLAARTLRRWAGERFIPVGMRHGRPVYDIRTVRKAAERVRKPSTGRRRATDRKAS